MEFRIPGGKLPGLVSTPPGDPLGKAGQALEQAGAALRDGFERAVGGDGLARHLAAAEPSGATGRPLAQGLAGAVGARLLAALPADLRQVPGLDPEAVGERVLGGLADALAGGLAAAGVGASAAASHAGAAVDAIGSPLVGGVVGWLADGAAAAGIEPPDRFDLAGVVEVAFDVLGITVDRLREKATGRLGEAPVTAAEAAAGATVDGLRTVVAEGPAVVWDELRERLRDVAGAVSEAVGDFLLERVVVPATARLATMVGPAAAAAEVAAAVVGEAAQGAARASELAAGYVGDKVAAAAGWTAEKGAAAGEVVADKAGAAGAWLLGTGEGVAAKAADKGQAAADWAEGKAASVDSYLRGKIDR